MNEDSNEPPAMDFAVPALGFGLTLAIASIGSIIVDHAGLPNVLLLLLGSGISLGSYVNMKQKRG